MQSSDEKDRRIRQLENENRTLQEKVDLLEHNVEALIQAVLHASKKRFGASSEKTSQIYGQCFLFGELIDEVSDETENKVINIKENIILKLFSWILGKKKFQDQAEPLDELIAINSLN